MPNQIYRTLGLFIDGALRQGTGTSARTVVNPATGTLLAELPAASEADIADTIAVATRAFATWRWVPAVERSAILRGAAALLRERRERVAAILTLEQGKIINEALAEVSHAADMFEWFAEEGRRAYGRVIPSRAPGLTYTTEREPVGPVAAFTPWNVPAVIPARKIAGALAAGCSCIIKPAEETPGTCLELASALQDAGIPDGVLQVLTGEPAMITERLVSASEVRLVSFTGSTEVGRQIAALAAAEPKPALLELSGHAPVIVAADADLDYAVRLSVAQKYRNAGQVCISPTRFLIEAPVYDTFRDRFVEAVRAIEVGPGLEPASQMGPLANARRADAIEELTANAVASGAERLAGGRRISNEGFFFEPTVLARAPTTARIMNEEPFGPVAILNPVDTLDDALAEANRLPQALAAYAFARDSGIVRRIARDIEAGMVGINNFAINHPETPFGGIKQSGYGSEGGAEGLDAYLTTKFVSES